MLIHKTEDIEQKKVEMDGAERVSIRWLLSKSMGTPNFAMREFTIEPNGFTPYHQHKWEHEVYVLEGKGAVVSKDGDKPVSKESVILIKGDEMHSFKNTGTNNFKFLCLIPND